MRPVPRSFAMFESVGRCLSVIAERELGTVPEIVVEQPVSAKVVTVDGKHNFALAVAAVIARIHQPHIGGEELDLLLRSYGEPLRLERIVGGTIAAVRPKLDFDQRPAACGCICLRNADVFVVIWPRAIVL